MMVSTRGWWTLVCRDFIYLCTCLVSEKVMQFKCNKLIGIVIKTKKNIFFFWKMCKNQIFFFIYNNKFHSFFFFTFFLFKILFITFLSHFARDENVLWTYSPLARCDRFNLLTFGYNIAKKNGYQCFNIFNQEFQEHKWETVHGFLFNANTSRERDTHTYMHYLWSKILLLWTNTLSKTWKMKRRKYIKRNVA